MTDNEIRTFRIGVPGPPGVGITEAELAILQGDIAELFEGSYRGRPLQAGGARQTPYVGYSVGGATVPGVTVTLSGLNATKFHRVLGQGRAVVTTTVDEILEVGITMTETPDGIVDGTNPAPADITPTSAGTYILKFYGAWDVHPGATSVAIAPWLRTDIATNVTFDDIELDLTVIPQTV